MARRRFGGPRVIGHKRETNWISLTGDPDNALSVGNNAAALLASIASAEGLGPVTIVRVRGHVGLLGTEPTSALIGVGICVVSDQAADLGITAIPHPVTDENWDGWLWRDTRYFGSGMRNEVDDFPIDSKAMRKLDDDQALVTVAEVVSINVGGGAVIVAINGRVLFKHP